MFAGESTSFARLRGACHRPAILQRGDNHLLTLRALT
jgi:hypothetical protein